MDMVRPLFTLTLSYHMRREGGTFVNSKRSQESCNSQKYIVLTKKNSSNFENCAFTTFFLDVPVAYNFDIYKSPGWGLKFKSKYFFSLPNVLDLRVAFFKKGQHKKTLKFLFRLLKRRKNTE